MFARKLFLASVLHCHPVEELEGAVRFPGHDPASDLQVALGAVRINRRKRDSIVDAKVPPLLPTSGMGESNMTAVKIRPHWRDLRFTTWSDSGDMPDDRKIE